MQNYANKLMLSKKKNIKHYSLPSICSGVVTHYFVTLIKESKE